MHIKFFIMKKSILCTAAIAAASAIVMASDNKDAYLFVFHQDATHGLYMATSYDGYNFTALNNAKPVMAADTLATQHGIRDPHIYRGPDGAFYLALTDLHIFGKQAGYRDTEWERPGNEHGWGNNHGFVLMKSNDLINWKRTVVHVDKMFPHLNVSCAWAPETIYDPVAKRMMLYYTMRLDNGKTKLYYSYTDPEFTKLETEPVELFKYPNPDIQVLDADICPMPDGRYCMTYVAQDQPVGIRMAVADSITGPYKYMEKWLDSEPGHCEAPTIWKRNGQDKWVLMYDVFSVNPHNFGFCETTDFDTFTPLGRFNEGKMRTTNFTSPKHGAVISITSDEAHALERRWAKTVPTDSILLSDPCVLPDPATGMYYMTGTSGLLWESKDLKNWTGPFHVAKHNPDSWMGERPAIWAAELHRYNDKYYYFATFTNDSTIIAENHNGRIPRRASHIFVSDKAYGPYRPISDADYLPDNRPTLDGTFWVDRDGSPYMIFCGEWLANDNGTMEYIKLTPDLSASVGKPQTMFRAFDAPWSRERIDGKVKHNRVTDGPWLFRTGTGRLGMIWTSWIFDRYTMGVAYSKSGTLRGPWIQEPNPITPPDHGHGMIFRDFDGSYKLSLHSHASVNGRYIRRPVFYNVDISGDKLVIGDKL